MSSAYFADHLNPRLVAYLDEKKVVAAPSGYVSWESFHAMILGLHEPHTTSPEVVIAEDSDDSSDDESDVEIVIGPITTDFPTSRLALTSLDYNTTSSPPSPNFCNSVVASVENLSASLEILSISEGRIDLPVEIVEHATTIVATPSVLAEIEDALKLFDDIHIKPPPLSQELLTLQSLRDLLPPEMIHVYDTPQDYLCCGGPGAEVRFNRSLDCKFLTEIFEWDEDLGVGITHADGVPCKNWNRNPYGYAMFCEALTIEERVGGYKMMMQDPSFTISLVRLTYGDNLLVAPVSALDVGPFLPPTIDRTCGSEDSERKLFPPSRLKRQIFISTNPGKKALKKIEELCDWILDPSCHAHPSRTVVRRWQRRRVERRQRVFSTATRKMEACLLSNEFLVDLTHLVLTPKYTPGYQEMPDHTPPAEPLLCNAEDEMFLCRDKSFILLQEQKKATLDALDKVYVKSLSNSFKKKYDCWMDRAYADLALNAVVIGFESPRKLSAVMATIRSELFEKYGHDDLSDSPDFDDFEEKGTNFCPPPGYDTDGSTWSNLKGAAANANDLTDKMHTLLVEDQDKIDPKAFKDGSVFSKLSAGVKSYAKMPAMNETIDKVFASIKDCMKKVMAFCVGVIASFVLMSVVILVCSYVFGFSPMWAVITAVVAQLLAVSFGFSEWILDLVHMANAPPKKPRVRVVCEGPPPPSRTMTETGTVDAPPVDEPALNADSGNSEEKEFAMELKAFPSASALALGICALTAAGENKKSFMCRVQTCLATLPKVRSGVASTGDLMDWGFPKLPECIQTAIGQRFGLAGCNLPAAYKRAIEEGNRLVTLRHTVGDCVLAYPNFARRVLSVYTLLNNYLYTAAGNNNAATMRVVTHTLRELQKLVPHCETTMGAGSNRPKPVCICLSGPSRIGKTVLVDYIARGLFGKVPTSDLMFVKNTSSKHWDGYTGQKAVLFDDFYSVDPQFAETNPFSDLLVLIGDKPAPIPMAALEDKGRKFTSEALFLTMNRPLSGSFSTLTNPEAFQNRFELNLWCTVRKEYRLPGSNFPNWPLIAKLSVDEQALIPWLTFDWNPVGDQDFIPKYGMTFIDVMREARRVLRDNRRTACKTMKINDAVYDAVNTMLDDPNVGGIPEAFKKILGTVDDRAPKDIAVEKLLDDIPEHATDGGNDRKRPPKLSWAGTFKKTYFAHWKVKFGLEPADFSPAFISALEDHIDIVLTVSHAKLPGARTSPALMGRLHFEMLANEPNNEPAALNAVYQFFANLHLRPEKISQDHINDAKTISELLEDKEFSTPDTTPPPSESGSLEQDVSPTKTVLLEEEIQPAPTPPPPAVYKRPETPEHFSSSENSEGDEIKVVIESPPYKRPANAVPYVPNFDENLEEVTRLRAACLSPESADKMLNKAFDDLLTQAAQEYAEQETGIPWPKIILALGVLCAVLGAGVIMYKQLFKMRQYFTDTPTSRNVSPINWQYETNGTTLNPPMDPSSPKLKKLARWLAPMSVWRNGELKHAGTATPYKGSCYLFPRHLVFHPDTPNHFILDGTPMQFVIGGIEYAVPFEQRRCYGLSDARGNAMDLVLYKFPVSVAVAPDFSHYFPDMEDLKLAMNSDAYAFVKAELDDASAVVEAHGEYTDGMVEALIHMGCGRYLRETLFYDRDPRCSSYRTKMTPDTTVVHTTYCYISGSDCVAGGGWCGNPVFAITKGEPYIACLHAWRDYLTNDHKEGRGIALSQQFLEREFKNATNLWNEMPPLKRVIAMDGGHKIPLTQQEVPRELQPIGMTETHGPLQCPGRYQTSKTTQLEPSVLYEAVPLATPHKFEPAVLTSTDPRTISDEDLLVRGVNKYATVGRPFSEKMLTAATEMVYNELVVEPDHPPQLRTFDECAGGVAELYMFKHIDMSSSPGIPWKNPGVGGKRHLFSLTDDGKYILSDAALKKAVAAKERLARAGIMTRGLWQDALKDELRSLEKIRAGKTRHFTICPVDFTLLFRRYCGDFMSFFYSRHLKCFSAVGINVESPEWTDLVEGLLKVSNLGFDVDFSGWDGSVSPQLMEAACEVVDRFYREYDGDYNSEDTVVRMILFIEMMHTYEVCNAILIETHTGIPSGTPATVVVNSIVNALLFRLCYIGLTPPKFTILDFPLHARDYNYGDDLIAAVSKALGNYLNGESMALYLKKAGFKVTTADKGVSNAKLKPVLSLTFMKRSIVRDAVTVPGMTYLPLLEKDVIYRIVNWTRRANCPDQYQCELLEAMKYAFYHGEDFYRQLQKQIRSALKKVAATDFQSLRVPSYGEMHAEKTSGSYAPVDWRADPLSYLEWAHGGDCDPTPSLPPKHWKYICDSDKSGTHLDAPVEVKKATTPRVAGDKMLFGDTLCDESWTLLKLVERQQYHSTIAWASGTPTNGVLAHYRVPWDLIPDVEVTKIAFNRLTYWRGSIDLRFEVAATKFHQGAVFVYFVPLTSWQEVQNFHVLSRPTQTLLTECILSATHNTIASLKIPFTFPKEALNLSDHDDTDFLGTLVIQQFTPLRFAPGGSDPVQINMFSAFPDSAFKIPRIGNATGNITGKPVTRHQKKLKRSYIVDGNITSAVRNYNIQKVVDSNIAIGASGDSFDTKNTVETETSALDRPPIAIQPMPMYRKALPYCANSTAIHFPNFLDWTPGENYQIKAAELGTGLDEMSIKHLLSRPTFDDLVEWKTTDAVNKILMEGYVCPCRDYPFLEIGETMEVTLLDYIASKFTYWSGTLRYTFQFLSTELHTGVLVFAVNYGSGLVPTGALDATSQYIFSFNLAKARTFVVDVPMLVPRKRLRVPNGPFDVDHVSEDYFAGTWSLRILNTLKASPAVYPSVDFYLCISAGENFTLSRFACNNTSLIPVYNLGGSFYDEDTSAVDRRRDEARKLEADKILLKRRIKLIKKTCAVDEPVEDHLAELKAKLSAKTGKQYATDSDPGIEMQPADLDDKAVEAEAKIISTKTKVCNTPADTKNTDVRDLCKRFYPAHYVTVADPGRVKELFAVPIAESFLPPTKDVDYSEGHNSTPLGWWAALYRVWWGNMNYRLFQTTGNYLNTTCLQYHPFDIEAAEEIAEVDFPLTQSRLIGGTVACDYFNSTAPFSEIEVPFTTTLNYLKLPKKAEDTQKVFYNTGYIVGTNLAQPEEEPFDYRLFVAFADETRFGILYGVPRIHCLGHGGRHTYGDRFLHDPAVSIPETIRVVHQVTSSRQPFDSTDLDWDTMAFIYSRKNGAYNGVVDEILIDGATCPLSTLTALGYSIGTENTRSITSGTKTFTYDLEDCVVMPAYIRVTFRADNQFIPGDEIQNDWTWDNVEWRSNWGHSEMYEPEEAGWTLQGSSRRIYNEVVITGPNSNTLNGYNDPAIVYEPVPTDPIPLPYIVDVAGKTTYPGFIDEDPLIALRYIVGGTNGAGEHTGLALFLVPYTPPPPPPTRDMTPDSVDLSRRGSGGAF